MKKFNFLKTLFAIFIPAIVLFSSCQKGVQGPAGATGSTGANGAAGASGNTLLSGDGVPSLSLGNSGDFYLELDSSNLYGPKTSAGWGSPVSLVGAAGAQGAAAAASMVDTFTVYSANWTVGGTAFVEFSNSEANGYPTQYYVRYNSIITNGILDSGMVLVYFTPVPSMNPGQWLPQPYTAEVNLSGVTVNLNYVYVTASGKVTLQLYLSQVNTNYSSLPDISTISIPDAHYKIVAVPGNVSQQIESIVNRKISKTGQISNY